MLLVGYCYSVRSERRLCQEVEFNLAYRWFCCLGLEDAVPDHSTFSVNRHGRFRDSDVFRLVFESVVRQCMGTTRGRHKVMFGYSFNYLIDMTHAVIIDVEATPTRISKEVDATETMV